MSEASPPFFPYDDIPTDPETIISIFLSLSDPSRYGQDDPGLVAAKRDVPGLLDVVCGGRGARIELFHRGPRAAGEERIAFPIDLADA